jgi:hypothetical protein
MFLAENEVIYDILWESLSLTKLCPSALVRIVQRALDYGQREEVGSKSTALSCLSGRSLLITLIMQSQRGESLSVYKSAGQAAVAGIASPALSARSLKRVAFNAMTAQLQRMLCHLS